MKCWFCGKDKMEPIDGMPKWFQCSGCGATDGPSLPKLRLSPVVEVMEGSKLLLRRRPRGSVD